MIPTTQFGGGLVSTLEKRHERPFRVARAPHGIIGQHEFAQTFFEISRVEFDMRVCKACRCRMGIRIEGGKIDSAAGPETSGKHFVAVGLACHFVGQCRDFAWMQWRGTSREARNAKSKPPQKRFTGSPCRCSLRIKPGLQREIQPDNDNDDRIDDAAERGSKSRNTSPEAAAPLQEIVETL